MDWTDFGQIRAPAAWATATAVACAALMMAPRPAKACGCLSPPDPAVVGVDEFAVNQQSEQIIFEVGETTVTAHVLIRYAGQPEQFAWLVPVPNAPELQISELLAFGMIDEQTRPSDSVTYESLCPDPEYRCEYHPTPPSCPRPDSSGSAGSDNSGDSGESGDSGDDGDTGDSAPDDSDDGTPPGIDVIDMQQVGSYETVTFSADEASLAVEWLQTNGFIVNDTMTPYMQPYLDAGMVFVAAKLVAGAGIDEIAPLQMTYEGQNPMIPLQLTAVAAEPHLTVTSYIYADDYYAPIDHPLVEIDPRRIANEGRSNYPMLLAAEVDEAGGDGFVAEYWGPPVSPNFFDASGCCGSLDDCGIGGDLSCQCPTSAFDQSDCADVPGLLGGIDLVSRLAAEHSHLTRLTTRLSPEEMTFDPMFGPGVLPGIQGRLRLENDAPRVDDCSPDIVDQAAVTQINDSLQCSSLYCDRGECAPTQLGAGCLCQPGFVAKQFTDLDGAQSVTCVPEIGPVDLGAATTLPDVCEGVDCGAGSCVPVGGFPTCACDPGFAAITGFETPTCAEAKEPTGSPGAESFRQALRELEICAPAPPTCAEYGWLVPNENKSVQGTICASSMPEPGALEVPAPPPPRVCTDDDRDTWGDSGESSGLDDDGGGCACSTGHNGRWTWTALSMLLLVGVRLRRLRKRPGTGSRPDAVGDDGSR